MDRQATGGYQLYNSSGPRSLNAPDWSNPAPSASFSLYNHQQPPSPPSNPMFAFNERVDRGRGADARDNFHAPHPSAAQAAPPRQTASTVWWGELEPWMDEEYVKQVCALMKWSPLSIKVPHPVPDPLTGQHANNPGYCFLTFASASIAASVLAQVNSPEGGPSQTMPNSTKPFVLDWAASMPPAPTPLSPSFAAPTPTSAGTPQYPKEYSIFVGDLAPETSNSDLVAVFRNPVLGLRNDREPKFIRPFLSCKSAKIMLDPVTGVSRGYGFVRFTDEGDQQRALVEMHGLYCLSRPMRISPATAKFKPPTMVQPQDLPQVQFPPQSDVTIAVPLHSLAAQARSVTGPFSTSPSNASLRSAPSGMQPFMDNSNSGTSLNSHASAPNGSPFTMDNMSDEMMNLPHHVLAQIAKQYATGERDPPKATTAATSITSQFAHDRPANGQDQRYFAEESWKHHAQAQAILGNLIGPNGEQLTSTDPYNTTVFVGGLSPLISEETLRTFFVPFGDIHYVKVPVGKHCGFVQFVRKVDAERAIEKMQGFPVGGSRIRLSWGRSQYKAAQAAAQAAQTAALQSHIPAATPAHSFGLTPEQLQAMQRMKMAQMAQSPTHGQFPHVADADQYDLAPPPRKSFSPFGADSGNIFVPNQRDAYPNFSPNDFYRNEREDAPKGRAGPARYSTYLRDPSPPSNRAPGRPDSHHSRPSSRHVEGHELDLMHDLNGTLASLDLDRDRVWKSPTESSDSGASVQFQMSMNSATTPN